jgi:hypothetical protein
MPATCTTIRNLFEPGKDLVLVRITDEQERLASALCNENRITRIGSRQLIRTLPERRPRFVVPANQVSTGTHP